MALPFRLRPEYRLPAMFVATIFVLVAALAAMSVQLLRQDRALAGRRLQERRENAADLAATALQKQLSDIQAQLTQFSTVPAPALREQAARYAAALPEDSALLLFSTDGLAAFPAGRLLFYPDVPPGPVASPGVFAGTDQLEFGQQDCRKAIELLRPLAVHPDPGIAAEARARLARNLAKNGQMREASAAYGELLRAGSLPVAGLPAELVAREGRLLLFEKMNDEEARRREATALASALREGRWRLHRAAFDFYLSEAERAAPGGGATAPPEMAPAFAVSEAAGSVWEEWRARGDAAPGPYRPSRAPDRAGGPGTRDAAAGSRRISWRHDQPVLLLERGSPERLVALALGRQYVEQRWLTSLQSLLAGYDVRIGLSDAEGRTVAGFAGPPGSPQSVRLPADTQLPWALHATSLPGAAAVGFASRPLLFTALLTLFLLVLGGTYFVVRAAAREVAVARLESDFVASVSHEFRTPITALRQLSELLVSGRVASDEDRDEYYRTLARESERLHRLVEGLLNFGRIEAGAMHFRFEPLDAAELVSSVVNEFRRDAEARGYRVEFAANGPVPVRADRAAVGCVLWNLLDNAIKYSPECNTVWVELGRGNGCVSIRVRDRGIGIPEDEQKHIFEKFVRGVAAKTGSIRGAGVGLALARGIITAHGGDITVQSRPGEGSTFTVSLRQEG